MNIHFLSLSRGFFFLRSSVAINGWNIDSLGLAEKGNNRHTSN